MRESCSLFLGKSDLIQDIRNLLFYFFLGAADMMDLQSFRNDLRDLLTRIETGHRVLEDHLHVRPEISFIISV